MNKICSYLDVVRADEFPEDGSSGFVVEDCAAYDSVLENFRIVCKAENVAVAKEWIIDNCRNVGKHAGKSIDKGNGAFAFSLVKTVLRISSYTEEFVGECGSVQGFLDMWGDKNTVLPPDSLSTDVLHTDDAVFSELESQGSSQDENGMEDFLGLNFTMSIPEDEAGSDEVEEQDNWEEAEEEKVPDSKADAVGEELAAAGDVIVEEEAIATSDTAVAKEEVIATSDTAVAREEATATSDTAVVREEPASTREPVAGIELPFSSGTAGNVVIPYKDLLNVAILLRKAAEQMELDEIPDTELLTREDKAETLKYLDEFSSSLIKRFFIFYVASAETDIDYVRVTKMLDEFCGFVENEERSRLEVGYEQQG